MGRKKKRKQQGCKTKTIYENLPTIERLRHGGITIRSHIAQVDESLRIDKLLTGGIIDEMQHLYGMQIITLWTIARRPFLKSIQYERTASAPSGHFELIHLGRMSAEDQFYKTMGYLCKRDHDLISKICFEEIAAIAAGRQLGLPVNSITVYVRAAFDALGDALARMRDLKKALEKASDVQMAESAG